jgi:GTP diphosphokinase / guanosine-3',5'-bis(diphosphate) 3'-diphosphatase
MTSPQGEPRRDWLQFVKTTRARSKIRQYLKTKTHEESVTLGREMLERETRRLRGKMPTEKGVVDLAQSFGFEDAKAFLAALGRGDISAIQAARKIAPPEEPAAPPPTAEEAAEGQPRGPRPHTRGVVIQDVDHPMINFAKCCQPVPGDPIVGFITRGRGVTVHRVGCTNTLRLLSDPERQIRVEWDTGRDQTFLVSIAVVGEDRAGFLADVAAAICATQNTNIISADVKSIDLGARGNFVIAVRNLSHLEEVVRAIRKVKSVLGVQRFEVG